MRFGKPAGLAAAYSAIWASSDDSSRQYETIDDGGHQRIRTLLPVPINHVHERRKLFGLRRPLGVHSFLSLQCDDLPADV